MFQNSSYEPVLLDTMVQLIKIKVSPPVSAVVSMLEAATVDGSKESVLVRDDEVKVVNEAVLDGDVGEDVDGDVGGTEVVATVLGAVVVGGGVGFTPRSGITKKGLLDRPLLCILCCIKNWILRKITTCIPTQLYILATYIIQSLPHPDPSTNNIFFCQSQITIHQIRKHVGTTDCPFHDIKKYYATYNLDSTS